MASSSSLGNASLANASSAHAFYVEFGGSTLALLDEIRRAGTAGELHEALQRYATLRAELTRAVDSGVLPAHDQRVHRRRLDDVAAALEERRTALEQIQQQEDKGKGKEGGKKKGGFAFRRKLQSNVVPAEAATAASAVLVEPRPSTVVETTPRASHITVCALHDTVYTRASPDDDPTSTPTPISLEIGDISHSLVDLRALARSHTVLSVQIRSVSHSILLLPSICGSAMLHQLSHSMVHLPSCHQFRMHTSHHTAIALQTKRGSVATLEACNNVTLVALQSEVKVQDFEDLFNSEQLKHHATAQQQLQQEEEGEGRKKNFRVLHTDDADLAGKVVRWSEETGSVAACLEKVWDELVGEA